jgi:hypothetical protein
LRSSHVCERALAASVIALGIGVAVVPHAHADPNDPAPTNPPTPGPISDSSATGPVSAPAPDTGNADPAAVAACQQFAAALDGASAYYGDFADSIEGTENPDYWDPSISVPNVTGRTALRQAAAAALDAAGTPGLSPDIADPMRLWSWDATKLLVKMGVHGGGQSLSDTATEMNTDASNAQMGCAHAGTHA